MINDISIKQETIIDAAMKRFSHFGVNKTTLTEIANDLNISKTLLFYYFNDKKSLITAVFEKLVHDFLQEYRHRLLSVTTAKEGLLLYVDVKQEMFKKHRQLAMQVGSIQINHYAPRILKVIIKAQNEALKIVTGLLNKGVERNELHPVDSEKVARILLETIQSFETCMNASTPFPDEKEIDQLAHKQKEAVKLFFNGLKIR